MVDKINVEIPLDLAKEVAGYNPAGPAWVEVVKAIKEALPQEYPDGTIAWVTTKWSVYLLVRENGAWAIRRNGETYIWDEDVRKVEPLQVAGEDELVVRRPPIGTGMREAINYLRLHGYSTTPDWLEEVCEVAKRL